MTVISGEANMETYRALVLKSGLGLMVKGVKPACHWTKKLALANVNAITGKTDKSYEAAIASIEAWLAAHPFKNDINNEVKV